MRTLASSLLAAGSFLALGAQAYSAPDVVVTIKPIHSLAAGVMKGVGEPKLLVEGAGSPHGYSLKPSQAASLQDAELIVWVGPELETFMIKPLETLGHGAHKLPLSKAPGLELLPFREGGPFEKHNHDHEEHDHESHDHADHEGHDHDTHDHETHAEHDHDHDEHAHEEEHAHAEHGHDDHAHDDHGHDEHHEHDDHAHGEFDAHMWLDPLNAKAFVATLSEELSEIDPENAATYADNAEKLMARLDNLTAEITGEMKAVQGKPFIVFHDAYQYFENRFDVPAAGSVTVSPERAPGAERVAEIQHRIEDLNATCVFSEPQFEPKIVKVLVEGTDAKSGELDPLGATMTPGEDQYFELIRGLAASLKECLKG
ncbi:zinc ABC transporter substrate-binding protein [Pseudovibrio sp. SPO723]|uniref:zinc ABC transporter substrate-binding protein n=1 Tax=Nesiotobacter zosterae TaxID=392721 RepID=UPI0029C33802|nr:zinc ABC transporter substrate-binding protein [Pseudovibrio sp. SPO723]MDX5591944.1 zinc ABC transporter substrate-binding protein [Pseudovibrio sp. SPO723]